MALVMPLAACATDTAKTVVEATASSSPAGDTSPAPTDEPKTEALFRTLDGPLKVPTTLQGWIPDPQGPGVEKYGMETATDGLEFAFALSDYMTVWPVMWSVVEPPTRQEMRPMLEYLSDDAYNDMLKVIKQVETGDNSEAAAARGDWPLQAVWRASRLPDGSQTPGLTLMAPWTVGVWINNPIVETCNQNGEQRMCFQFITTTSLVVGDVGTATPSEIFPLERRWQVVVEENPDPNDVSPWLATGVRITNTEYGDMRPITEDDLS